MSDFELMQENENLKKEIAELKNCNGNGKRRKTDNWAFMWLPKIIEVMIILIMVFAGMKFTLNNLVSRVDKVEIIVGTSSGKEGNLCERTTKLETYIPLILKELESINKKIEARGR